MICPQTSQDWLSVNLYVQGQGVLDQAVPEVLHWVSNVAMTYNIDSWFFIRYLDINGHHVRLRIRAHPDEVDQLWRQADKLVPRIAALPMTDFDELVPDPIITDVAGTPRLAARVYSPEYAKYGGPVGVDIAEQLFNASSWWHVRHADLLVDRQNRIAALLWLHAELDRQLSRTGFGHFTPGHMRKWGARLRFAVHSSSDALAGLAEQVLCSARQADPACRQAGSDLASVVAWHWHEYRAASCPTDPPAVLLDYLHMEANRLGFTPAEECFLGQVATALATANTSEGTAA